MPETRTVETPADLLALREDTTFHDGALAVLTFPTADPIGFLSYDNPKYFGRQIIPGRGVTVSKGEAGDFEVTP